MWETSLYITFSFLYMITMGVILWILLDYSGVPRWVWYLFAIAIVLRMIALIIFVVIIDDPDPEISFWPTTFIILEVSAFLIILFGLWFTFKYSIIPWWIWGILALAYIFNILVAFNLLIKFYITASIFSILHALTHILGLVLFVYYSGAPLWIWGIIFLSIIFSTMATIFEGIMVHVDSNKKIDMDYNDNDDFVIPGMDL